MSGVLLRIEGLSFLDAREFWDLEKNYSQGRWNLDDIEAAATKHNLMKKLNGAPLASWFLARLQYLWQSVTGPVDVSTPVDDGGYSFDFLVVEGRIPVAEMQVYAHQEAIQLSVSTSTESKAKEIAGRLVEALFENALVVARCECRLRSEMRESYEWGWDGVQFLGAGNPPR